MEVEENDLLPSRIPVQTEVHCEPLTLLRALPYGLVAADPGLLLVDTLR